MPKTFILNGWLAQPDLNAFTRYDRTVRVEPKVMDICVRLAQSPGVVVSKRELLDSVWPDAAVGEDALTRAISELRRALEDDARTPEVIETIPKRGYRLIAAIHANEVPPVRAQRKAAGVAIATFIVIGLVTAAAVWVWANRQTPRPGRLQTVSPLLLLAVFENGTGNPNLEPLVRGSIESELIRNHGLAFASKGRVANGLARMRRDAEPLTHVDTALELASGTPKSPRLSLAESTGPAMDLF